MPGAKTKAKAKPAEAPNPSGWSEWEKRSAYLLIQGEREAVERIWNKAQKWDECIGAWLVTGQWDLLIWADASSFEDLYDRAVEIRGEKGVKTTSSHFVYKGLKNDRWWWDWPAGSWVFMRSPQLDVDAHAVTKWDWVISLACVPGDWDYMVWAGGKTWDQVWDHIWSLNKAGWHTQTLVPMKSWWNKKWKNKWWS